MAILSNKTLIGFFIVFQVVSTMHKLSVLAMLLVGFFFFQPLRASDPGDSTKTLRLYGLRLHQGSVLIHSRDLRPIRNSYPTGLEFDLGWHQVSQKAWESCHCYPKLGAAISFWEYDNPDVLGQGITGMFYIEPVFGAWQAVSFSIRAAFGLSYQNQPYDEVTNPDNLSYSTYVAFPLQLGGNAHIRLHPQWFLDVTAVYNHFSNGGIREPNKGINWPSVALGVAYYPQAPEFRRRAKKDWRSEGPPDSRLDASFFLAFHEPVSKLYLFSPGIELKYSRQVARINALTLGAEWMYDNSDRYEIEQAEQDESPHKASVALGHEFLLGKFLFSQQFGFYVFNPWHNADVYQRYGLVFRASRRFSFGINLKAHGHVADFLDIRAGVSF